MAMTWSLMPRKKASGCASAPAAPSADAMTTDSFAVGDAPEIDGAVLIRDAKGVKVGDIIQVKIDSLVLDDERSARPHILARGA